MTRSGHNRLAGNGYCSAEGRRPYAGLFVGNLVSQVCSS